MYFNNLIFLPLLLAGMSLAGEDTCPAGAVEVVVVETVTITDYSLVHPTTIAPSGASSVSPVSAAESTTPATLVAASAQASSVSSISVAESTPSGTLVASSAQTSSWTTVKQPTSTTSVSTVQPISSSTAATSASAAVSTSETFVGLGTRYGDDCTEEDCWQNGACSFVDYELPSGIDGSTCVSQDIWNNGANCGGCISVTYKGKTITVMVTNETGGNATHLDMTPATWSKLTNGYSGGGVDGIEWEWITCPIATTTPLEIRMHGGASKYWFAATVENARLRTAKLEVSSDSGATWTAAVLENYNMWVLDGTLPNSTAWVRVTSVEGDQVVVEDVTLQSGVITQATENY